MYRMVRVRDIKSFRKTGQTFWGDGKTFRRDGQSFWTTSKPLEMAPKPLGTTAKGFENRSQRSVREEKSEFDRAAPEGDPWKRRPTRPSRRLIVSIRVLIRRRQVRFSQGKPQSLQRRA